MRQTISGVHAKFGAARRLLTLLRLRFPFPGFRSVDLVREKGPSTSQSMEVGSHVHWQKVAALRIFSDLRFGSREETLLCGKKQGHGRRSGVWSATKPCLRHDPLIPPYPSPSWHIVYAPVGAQQRFGKHSDHLRSVSLELLPLVWSTHRHLSWPCHPSISAALPCPSNRQPQQPQ